MSQRIDIQHDCVTVGQQPVAAPAGERLLPRSLACSLACWNWSRSGHCNQSKSSSWSWMPPLLLQVLLTMVLLSLLLGCETQPVIPSGPGLNPNQLQELVAASNWQTIAAANINCSEPSDTCAEAHAIRADACLRLAIQLPAHASATRGQTRKLLDDAETGYRNALQLQRSSESPSVSSYHGGLLLTLSERRNRLDDSVRENKLDRENQKLLEAAEKARKEVPDSALGHVYGASALVYHALLKESGTDRCDGLSQAATMLKQSPEPPAELTSEQQRLRTLIKRGLGESNCASAAQAL